MSLKPPTEGTASASTFEDRLDLVERGTVSADLRQYDALGTGDSSSTVDSSAISDFFADLRASITSTSPYNKTRANTTRTNYELKLPPGQFVITSEDVMGAFANGTITATPGLKITGAGRGATILIFAPTDGTDTFLWRNDVFSRIDFADLTFYGSPSQTVQDKRDRDRYPGFMHSKVSSTSTTVQNYTFTRCDIKGFWRDFLKLETWDNNDSLSFWHCGVYSHTRDFLSVPATAISGANPDQALNFNFFGCQVEMSSGNFINMPFGGNVLCEGGSYFHLIDDNSTNCPNAVLSGAHTASTTTITAVSATAFANWPTSGLAKIDTELVYYSSRTDQALTVTRGADFTIAAAHSDGATIYQPGGGCLFLIPYAGTTHAAGTERFEVKSIRSEMRTVDSSIMRCGWESGIVAFEDFNLIKGQVTNTHKPFRFHQRGGMPQVNFDRCRLGYKVEFSYSDDGGYNTTRLPKFNRCTIEDYDEAWEFVTFTNTDSGTNTGNAIAVEFDGCRGRNVTGSYKFAFDCILNWQQCSSAAPKRRIAALKNNSRGKLPGPSGTSAVKWLPQGAKITRIILRWGPQAESGVSAVSSDWQYQVQDLDALVLLSTDPIANASLGAAKVVEGSPYISSCTTDNKRKLSLTRTAGANTQEPIGDCLVEYLA